MEFNFSTKKSPFPEKIIIKPNLKFHLKKYFRNISLNEICYSLFYDWLKARAFDSQKGWPAV